MTHRLLRPIGHLLAALAMLVLLPGAALAQFENPNRAFHKGTAFPLDGRHLTVACESCHLEGVYAGTPTACESCHWERRQDDPFKTRLGLECAQCHRTTTWSAVTWDHTAATGVSLNASHRTVSCEGCHRDAQFRRTSTNCITCHRRDFDATTEPNHAAAGFSTACDGCHRVSDTTFRGVVFDHNATFPLVGVHASQTCASCHTDGRYLGTPRDCVGCHRTDYDLTTSPGHASAGFSTACETCHRETDPDWTRAVFNHAEVFALNGRHGALACSACHADGTYRGTPRDCVGCHRTEYDSTTSPNHAAAGFSTDCATCHRDSDPGWPSGSGAFDHDQFFTLLGVHAFQACSSCHTGGTFAGTPRLCAGCHLDEYKQTAMPSHQAAGFSTNCEDCHSGSAPAWSSGAGFNHAAVFPLVGQHAQASCATCHTGGVYAGTPQTCVGCHLPEYAGTTQPSHVGAGFPTTCQDCHDPAAATWSNGGFDHNAAFPLVGRHAAATCQSCHTNGTYAGTPRDCYSCHRTEYESTTSPNHPASGFPTTCDSCHKATDPDWDRGVFVHSWFPITSGAHKIFGCVDCHQNPAVPTVFTCTTCHTPGKTNNDHSGVSGYVYDSAACYACHPNGKSDPAPLPLTRRLLARSHR